MQTKAYQIRGQAKGNKYSMLRANFTRSKGSWQRQQHWRPKQKIKVAKVTRAKTGTKISSRNNASHIASFTAKAPGTTTKIVRRQKRHRKG